MHKKNTKNILLLFIAIGLLATTASSARATMWIDDAHLVVDGDFLYIFPMTGIYQKYARQDGRVVWAKQLEGESLYGWTPTLGGKGFIEPLDGYFHTRPLFFNGKFLTINYGDFSLISVDPESGRWERIYKYEDWEGTTAIIPFDPIPYGDVLISGGTYYVQALDPRSKTLKWNMGEKYGQFTSLQGYFLSRGSLFLLVHLYSEDRVATWPNFEMREIDPETGAVLRRFPRDLFLKEGNIVIMWPEVVGEWKEKILIKLAYRTDAIERYQDYDHRLVAFDPQTNTISTIIEQLNHQKYIDWEQSCPCVFISGDIVFYTLRLSRSGEEGERFILSARSLVSGNVLWEAENERPYAATDGKLFTASTSSDINCRNSENGGVIWTRKHIREEPRDSLYQSHFDFYEIELDPPRLYALSHEYLRALDSETGSLLWEKKLPSPVIPLKVRVRDLYWDILYRSPLSSIIPFLKLTLLLIVVSITTICYLVYTKAFTKQGPANRILVFTLSGTLALWIGASMYMAQIGPVSESSSRDISFDWLIYIAGLCFLALSIGAAISRIKTAPRGSIWRRMKMNSSAPHLRSGGEFERRYDIDWLRVLAVLLLLPYHTAVIFTRPYVAYIKSEPNAALEAFAYFLNQWHMALLFLVSGVGAWYSLETRTGGRFAGERVRRLLIPLIFGTFAVVPVQVYFQRLYYGDFSGSFLQFYPYIFIGLYPHGNFTWGQLWFLAYLFVFSLLLLPVFVFLKTEDGRRHLSNAATFFQKPQVLFLAAIPFMISQAAFRAKWPGFQNLYNDWANFTFYIAAFFYGYALVSAPGFSRAIEKNRRIALGLAIATMTVILALRQSGQAPAPDYSFGWISYMLLHGFSSWLWLMAILGYARRWLNFNHAILEYANEAALPIYILHHAAIVTVAYFVVGWNVGLSLKLISIAAPALILAVVVYDLLIKRAVLLRFLFGMRSKARTIQPELVKKEQ